ncbi:MAG: nucleotidyltransferase family protein [Elainellaceae cyanobacterium]
MSPFNTDLLDAAIARRRERQEAQRLVALDEVTHWLETEGLRYGLREVYLFGSITRPYRFSDRSDIDVAVEEIGPEAFFMVMASLSEALGRDVDLVDLRKCHFAHRIRQQGTLWKREV